MSARARIRLRRRLGASAGLAVLALVSAACIFDKSDYTGGGRLDKGATAASAARTSATATATSPDPAPTDTTPVADAGGD
jgi:hypothetical protein